MARYRRRDAIETRLADALPARGRVFTADLIAKRATGVRGYKMTLGFFELEGTATFLVDLEPAESREDVQQRADELRALPEELVRLLEAQLGGG